MTEAIYHTFCNGCSHKKHNIHKYGMLCAVICGRECEKYQRYMVDNDE